MRRWWLAGLRTAGLVFSLVAVVLAVDALAGTRYLTGRDARLVVTPARSAAAKETLVVFPGYGMPGDLLSQAFAPYLPADEAMIVVRYPERGIDMDDIYRQVMSELARIGAGEIKIYGASMGGMCARDFLSRYARPGSPSAGVTLVLDSAPSSARRIKRPRWAYAIASWYRGGPVTTALWAAISRAGPKPVPAADADLRLVSAARHAGGWIGTPALTSQAEYIAAFAPLRDGEFAGVVTGMAYLRGSGTGQDPLIRTDESIADWRRTFPALTVVTVADRDARWHLPLIERPHETMKAVLAV